MTPILYDALLFDAGGVLVLPDPHVIGALLAPYGGDPAIDRHRRAHYAGMAAKARAAAAEADWEEYDLTYVAVVGVPAADRDDAALALRHTRNAYVWQWPIPESVAALAALSEAGVPIGVVSNAAGQVERALRRFGVCQVGEGPCAAVRCVVDSHVVGVAKPDPAIFEHALACFDGIAPDRIAYVGDSATTDVLGARAAGLVPILLDPYDDHAGATVTRIRSLLELLPREPARPSPGGSRGRTATPAPARP